MRVRFGRWSIHPAIRTRFTVPWRRLVREVRGLSRARMLFHSLVLAIQARRRAMAAVIRLTAALLCEEEKAPGPKAEGS